MSGTSIGGKKAAATIRAKHGKDFYKKLSSKGGSVTGTEKGFASSKVGKDGFTGPERAQILGSLAGALSRRKKVEGGA
jgi:hypothetical protein